MTPSDSDAIYQKTIEIFTLQWSQRFQRSATTRKHSGIRFFSVRATGSFLIPVHRSQVTLGQRSSDPQAMGQVTLTENFPDRTVWWGTQTITSLICENKCGFVEPLSYVPLVAKMSQPPIENMVWTNSHAYTQNRINLHNTLYLSKIITLFRVYPRSIHQAETCRYLSGAWRRKPRRSRRNCASEAAAEILESLASTTSITCKVMSQSFFGASKMRGDAQYASPHMNENTLP